MPCPLHKKLIKMATKINSFFSRSPLKCFRHCYYVLINAVKLFFAGLEVFQFNCHKSVRTVIFRSLSVLFLLGFYKGKTKV